MLSITDRLTHPGNPLYGLVIRAEYLNTIGKALAEYLGPPISYHCRLATISFDTVVLCVDSPVWYSKLRFLGPDIVRFLRIHCELTTISKVSIRVDPFILQDIVLRWKEENKRRLRLSPDVAKLLRNVAHATDNPALCEAWLRIANDGSGLREDSDLEVRRDKKRDRGEAPEK
uniref:DUF721 domain-containing protein n=1 Tax=Candidatus Kentrum sp. FM TaxID=2126340 RepID=A0A450TUT2_9GAMM|nr:MAG: hypothetical protein BECKFM1743C_GA0114222_102644 [Candidatus Kentron sp. FM]VFJ72687.1 MAG: hypothetical protein BECKFM1743A_GA0114220_106591 [Candidatus Kentron sp. FM]